MPTFTDSSLSWLSLILEERFGHVFIIEQGKSDLKLTLSDIPTGYILFPKLEKMFHLSSSDFPCTQWNAAQEGWVSVLDKPLCMPSSSVISDTLIKKEKNHYIINYDILGLTYWMLNRIEEIDRTDLDNHERFPATASHAYKYSYLERPIIDEWLHVLGQVIKRLWPMLTLTQHEFTTKISHDVDRPSRYGFRSSKGLVRAIGGDLIKQRSIHALWRAPYVWLNTKQHLNAKDPYNSFNWIMDKSEERGLVSAFYFICGGSHANDADYAIEHPVMRHLLRQMHERGHEIGLHPSYETYKTPELIKKEFDRLRIVCQQEGIEQLQWGGRMHYLRWQHPATLQAWNDAGLDYDSTLSYADRPGFRCGTCFEYPAFNTVTQKILKIRVRPLIAMESAVISSQYLGLGLTYNAKQKFIDLKNKCEKVSGVFTILWHNSEITNDEQKAILSSVLDDKL